MPSWARRIDQRIPRRWSREKDYNRNRSEAITSVILNLLFLVVLYKIPDWHLDFITGRYGTVMYILIFSSLVQIAGNLVIIILNFRILTFLSKILMEIVSFIALITFYYIYPLDFSGFPGFLWIDVILPWVLILAMIISVIKVISNIWKLIFGR